MYLYSDMAFVILWDRRYSLNSTPIPISWKGLFMPSVALLFDLPRLPHSSLAVSVYLGMNRRGHLLRLTPIHRSIDGGGTNGISWPIHRISVGYDLYAHWLLTLTVTRLIGFEKRDKIVYLHLFNVTQNLHVQNILHQDR